jgi:hypothetical protein
VVPVQLDALVKAARTVGTEVEIKIKVPLTRMRRKISQRARLRRGDSFVTNPN